MAKSDKKDTNGPQSQRPGPSPVPLPSMAQVAPEAQQEPKPIRFHDLDDAGKAEVAARMAKGEVALRGPDHIVVET